MISITSLIGTGYSYAQTVDFLFASTGFSAGAFYSRPLGIFYDTTRNECYIADTGNNQVVVCDKNGIPIYRFEHFADDEKNRTPGEPKSIVVDAKGRIFLTDASAPYLDVLDYRGVSLLHIYPQTPSARFDYLALGPNDEIYASVSGGEKRVVVIGQDLVLKRDIELERSKNEQVFISGLAIDKNQNIYLLNSSADVMVQIFDPSGAYIRGFGLHDIGFENFSFPSAITTMNDGTIWVADALRQTVSSFDQQGKYLTFIGGKGAELGAFNYPSGLASNGVDKLFVLERVGNRFQCFQLGVDHKSDNNETSVSRN